VRIPTKLTALPGAETNLKHTDSMPKKSPSKTPRAPAVDRAAAGSAYPSQPPIDNAHVAPGCEQFTGSKLSYAVEQRLRLIDFLLAQYGNVKRAALMDYFGTGEATATRDFGAYHDIAPGNMALNPSDKTYYRTNAFARVWL